MGQHNPRFLPCGQRLIVYRAIKKIPSVNNFWGIITDAQSHFVEIISHKKLPWYAEEKAKHGAYSTLLWLSIVNTAKFPIIGKCKALAIGDSNLIHVRNGKLLRSFPICSSEEFGNSPILISSNSNNNSLIHDYLKFIEFDCLPGDKLFLATDALSMYMLKKFEDNENPCTDIESIVKEDDPNQKFILWANDLRCNGKLKNDDTSLVYISLKTQLLLG